MVRIFVSHSWDATGHFDSTALLSEVLGPHWEDVSITRDGALQFSKDRQQAARETAALLNARLNVLGQSLQQLIANEPPTVPVLRQAAKDHGLLLDARRHATESARCQLRNAESAADLAKFSGRRNELIRKSQARLEALSNGFASSRELEFERSWLSRLMDWDDLPDAKASAQVRYQEALTAEKEAERLLKTAVAALDAACLESRKAKQKIADLRRRIDEEKDLIAELETAERALPNALDLRRVLPRGLGKFAQMEWLAGADLLTTNLALAIYERIGMCDIVVLALSDGFVYRQWLEFEFRAAADWLKPVIAIESAPVPQDFKYYAIKAQPNASSLRLAIDKALSSAPSPDDAARVQNLAIDVTGAGDQVIFGTREWIEDLLRSVQKERWTAADLRRSD